ncbi:hypothetical protein PYCCODRAFT_1356070, partial [Trametes coccinea BRFM310]
MGDAMGVRCAAVLNECEPWPAGDGRLLSDEPRPLRFKASRCGDVVLIEDAYLGMSCAVSTELVRRPEFDLPGWYAVQVHGERRKQPAKEDLEGVFRFLWDELGTTSSDPGMDDHLQLNAVRPRDAPPPVQRNAAATKDFKRVIPEPIVVVVTVNGQPARTLLDSGSLADFMSTKLAHQLGITLHELDKPLPVQLAVQGSRARVSCGCKADIAYQGISERRYFDVMNLLNYDLILGTPFLSAHRMVLGFNPVKVVVGSVSSSPVVSGRTREIASRAADVLRDELDIVRQELRNYAAPICREASDAPFPPLRAINHTIPLKDPSKVYRWRPSKCPDALRPLWIEKRDAYLASG